MQINVEERINSCSLKVNGKGQWSGEVKVYKERAADALSEAVDLALDMEDFIKRRRLIGTGDDIHVSKRHNPTGQERSTAGKGNKKG